MKPLRLLALLLLALYSSATLAHGLHMTRAEVVQRQQGHLTITIFTPLPALFARMAYPGKPASLVHLAAGGEQPIEQFRARLAALLHEEMRLTCAAGPIESIRYYLPSTQALRELIQGEVEEAVLALDAHAADHAHDADADADAEAQREEREEREHTHPLLRLDLDGFFPRHAPPEQLTILFPKALGPIQVSYSQPQVQTLTPDASGSHYHQTIP